MSSPEIPSLNSNSNSGDKPTTPTTPTTPTPTHPGFFDKTPERAASRLTYIKNYLAGVFVTVALIFSVFVIFWNALAKTPAYGHDLPGWIVDFDGGLIGQQVTQELKSQPILVKWTVIPANQFPAGINQIANDLVEESAWVAVTINQGSTARWASSLVSPDASYNGSDAITVMGVEARNENAYATIILPSVVPPLDAITSSFALQNGQRLSNFSLVPSILSISPQTLIEPLSYTIDNLIPYDSKVAKAVTFDGLIFQIIISFFIVIVGTSSRMASGLERSLSTRSLIALRFSSMFCSFFFISLFYSLLSRAFQLPLTRKFGDAGFVIFWMLNYCGMLSVGLALEAMSTILGKFTPFFMLTCILCNIAVCIYPIESMHDFYRYGYAAPLYNISLALRTIIFGTRNRVGFYFGILIAWIAISCITLPLFQWYMRRGWQPPPPPPPPQVEPDHRAMPKMGSETA